MSNISHFQATCERRLSDALSNAGFSVDKKEVRGESERFVYMEISGGQVKVWIYKDEPEFSMGEKSWIYEAPDYPENDFRIKAFVESVLACLKGDEPPDKGSSIIELFKGRPI